MFPCVAHILPLKLVDLVVGGVCQDVVAVVVHQELVLHALRVGNRFAQLPVRLSVQLIRLDEDAAALLCRLEEDEVGRDALVLSNFNDLAHLDVLRSDGRDAAHAALGALQDGVLRPVQLFVASVPIEVVHPLLNHRHNQYERKRCDVSEEEADFEEGYKLADGDQEKEQVEEEFELVVEHFRNEAEEVVLLVVEPI